MKDNNIYTYDIAAIILAYLRDEIDEEDQRKLEEWLKKSESHQVLLSRIRDEKMQYEDIRKYCHTMLIAHGYWCDKRLLAREGNGCLRFIGLQLRSWLFWVCLLCCG